MDNDATKIFKPIKWMVVAIIIALVVYFGNKLTYEHFVQLFKDSPSYLIIYLITWGVFLLLIYLYDKFIKSPDNIP